MDLQEARAQFKKLLGNRQSARTNPSAVPQPELAQALQRSGMKMWKMLRAGAPFNERCSWINSLPSVTQLNEAQREWAESMLEELKEDVKTARKLATLKDGQSIAGQIDSPMTYFLEQLLALDASNRLQMNDVDGACVSAEAILVLYQTPKSTAVQLMSFGWSSNHANITLERILAQGRAGDSQLQALQNRLKNQDFHSDLSEIITEVEYYLEQTFNPAGQLASGLVTGNRSLNQIFWFPSGQDFAILTQGNARRQQAETLRYFSEVLGRGLRDPRIPGVAAATVGLMTNSAFLQRMRTSLEAEFAGRCQSEAYRRCAIVALALERYRLKYGRWPEALKDLIPDFIEKIPVDPYDGNPIRYTKLADGVLVYSVGVDGVDNGGNVHPLKQFVSAGFDLGFRLWDPASRRQPAPSPIAPPPPGSPPLRSFSRARY